MTESLKQRQQVVETVVRDHNKYLRSFFMNRIRNLQDVDDYMQEFYIKLFTNENEIINMKSFLHTLALNVIRDKSRRANSEKRKEIRATNNGKGQIQDPNRDDVAYPDIELMPQEEQTISDDDPVVLAQFHRYLDNWFRAVGYMPKRQCESVILKRIYGYWNHEIAEIQGVSVSLIEKDLPRFRKLMRAA